MGCILEQHDETERKEQAIYYISKKIIDYESKYSSLKKNVLCINLDNSKVQTIHVVPYYMAHCKLGSYQIHLQETIFVGENCKIIGTIKI